MENGHRVCELTILGAPAPSAPSVFSMAMSKATSDRRGGGGGGGGSGGKEFDVDRLLDFEKRTGVKDGEIDSFITKVDAVNAAIQAMKVRYLHPVRRLASPILKDYTV